MTVLSRQQYVDLLILYTISRLVLIGKSISAGGLIYCNIFYLYIQVDVHAASQKEERYEFGIRYCTNE